MQIVIISRVREYANIDLELHHSQRVSWLKLRCRTPGRSSWVGSHVCMHSSRWPALKGLKP